MDDILQCCGLTKKGVRCRLPIGAPRRREGKFTCSKHDTQDLLIAQSKKQSKKQAPPMDASSDATADSDETKREDPMVQDQPEEIIGENTDQATPDTSDQKPLILPGHLERLHPEKLLDVTALDDLSRDLSSGAYSSQAPAEGSDPLTLAKVTTETSATNLRDSLGEDETRDAELLGVVERSVDDLYEKAIVEAVVENLTRYASVLTALAGFVSVAMALLYYLYLGFGVQSIAYDPGSLASAAIRALLVGMVFFLAVKWMISAKDKRLLEAHKARFNAAKDYCVQFRKVASEQAAYVKALNVLARKEVLQEEERKFRKDYEYASAMAKPPQGFVERIRRFWDKKKEEKKAQPAEPNERLNQSSDPAEILRLSASWEERANRLEALQGAAKGKLDEYVAQNADLDADQKLQTLKALESTYVALKARNAHAQPLSHALAGSDTRNLLFDILTQKKPLAVAFCAVVGVPAVVAGAFLWVTHWSSLYCDHYQWLPGPRCYNAEVAGFGVKSGTTQYLPKVFHVGTLDEEVFLIRPFVSLSDVPDLQPGGETSRLILPASSVVSLHRYTSTETEFRLGVDHIPPKPAPVLNLVQENSFVSVNNVAQANGGTTTGGTNVAYNVDNKFLSDQTSQETLSLAVANNFLTEKETIIHQPGPLISHFFFDNKPFDPPASETKRHVLVPFFLEPVAARELDKFAPIWEVGEADKISSKVQAFLAGFVSLVDPELEEPLQVATAAGFATPKNFLSTVRSILQTCVQPKTDTHDFRVEVTGYASMRGFPDASDDYNLYLAEGRRAAVILSVADRWEHIDLRETSVTDDGGIARLVVQRAANAKPEGPERPSPENSRPENSSSEDLSVDRFVELLRDGDPVELAAFLQGLKDTGTTAMFEAQLKATLFLFSEVEDMRTDLDLWSTRGAEKEKARPIEEGLQRSAMISLGKSQLMHCGI